MALRIIGGLLIVFGAVDLIGSFMEIDLWGTIGIELPELLWKYSAWIEIAAGYGLIHLAGQTDSDEAEDAAE